MASTELDLQLTHQPSELDEIRKTTVSNGTILTTVQDFLEGMNEKMATREQGFETVVKKRRLQENVQAINQERQEDDTYDDEGTQHHQDTNTACEHNMNMTSKDTRHEHATDTTSETSSSEMTSYDKACDQNMDVTSCTYNDTTCTICFTVLDVCKKLEWLQVKWQESEAQLCGSGVHDIRSRVGLINDGNMEVCLDARRHPGGPYYSHDETPVKLTVTILPQDNTSKGLVLCCKEDVVITSPWGNWDEVWQGQKIKISDLTSRGLVSRHDTVTIQYEVTAE